MRKRDIVFNIIRFIDAAIFDHFGPVRVLFVIQNRIGIAHQIPLIEGLAARPDINVAIVRANGGTLGAHEIEQYLTGLNVRIIPAWRATLSHWHFIFLTEMRTNRFLWASSIFVLHHGNTWGNSDRSARFGPQGIADYADYQAHGSRVSFFQSFSLPYHHGFLKRFPALANSPDFRSVVLGVPKLDRYKRPTAKERTDELLALGLDPERPTMVFLSHWTPKGLLPSLGFEAIEAVLSHPAEINLVLLGHEKLWRAAEDGSSETGQKMLRRIHDRVRQEGRFLFIPDEVDISRYLRLADMFVCDNSSVFVECLMYDRPILFFDHPDFEFSRSEIGHCYQSASLCFQTPGDIGGAIDMALNQPNGLAQARRNALEFMLARPGNAAAAAVDLIVRLGRVSGPHSLRWRRACKIVDEFNASIESH